MAAGSLNVKAVAPEPNVPGHRGHVEAVPPEPSNHLEAQPQPDSRGSGPDVQVEDVGHKDLRALADSMGQAVTALSQGVRFRIDETGGTLITQIVNRRTNEVIRQIPPEELLALSRRLREFLGILLDIEV